MAAIPQGKFSNYLKTPELPNRSRLRAEKRENLRGLRKEGGKSSEEFFAALIKKCLADPQTKDECLAPPRKVAKQRESSIFLFFNNCEKLLFTPEGGERRAEDFPRGAGWFGGKLKGVSGKTVRGSLTFFHAGLLFMAKLFPDAPLESAVWYGLEDFGNYSFVINDSLMCLQVKKHTFYMGK